MAAQQRLASFSRYRSLPKRSCNREGERPLSTRSLGLPLHAGNVVGSGTSLGRNSVLASMAGHDLRSALNAMVGWLHLIETKRAGPVLRARAAAGLAAAVGTQCDVVEAFLQGSRLVNGEVHARPARVDVHRLASVAVERYQGRARSTRVSLALAPVVQEVSWWCDPVLAEAALAALLAHGFTSSARGQALVLSVVVARERAALVLEGCPLPADIPLLLDVPGVRAPAAEGLHCGAGLLLSLAGSLALIMGGRLHASAPAQGAAAGWATLQLPAAPADRAATAGVAEHGVLPRDAAARVAGAMLAAVSVLVVDDRADMREMIKELLAGEGASVLTCDSAAQAISRHADWAAGPGRRLIVSDLSMPGTDGLALMRVLRAREVALGLPRTPSVALTARSEAHPGQEVADAGYDLLLGKPIQPATLVSRLCGLVGPATVGTEG